LAKHKQRKSKRKLGAAAALLSLGLVAFSVLAILGSGVIHVPSASPVHLDLIGDNGQTLTNVHVLDTWQEWTVGLTNGVVDMKTSATTAISFDLVPTENGEPSVLDITFPTKLLFKLPSYNNVISAWNTVLDGIPVLTVAVDGRAANEPYSNFQHVQFTSSDSVGIEKQWMARIVFSGNPPAWQNMIYVTGALAGKQKAFVQIFFTEVWTVYQNWLWSPTTQCGGGIQVGGAFMCQISQVSAPSPYGLNFDWTPSATGTASFTWPTGQVVSTDQYGGIIQLWTSTGTATITLWNTVTATLAGPPTTVTQTIGTVPSPGGGGNGAGQGLCAMLPSWLAWLCGSTWNIPNWLLISIGVVLFLILIAALVAIVRRSSGKTSRRVVVYE
jgi:hypothetical protein